MTGEDTTGLGATIRSWRDRVSPAAVGLPARIGRRTPGLRREELADLAGLSVDYVVRLEQGRAATPSVQVVGALARALQLTREERDHLFRLAGVQPPADGRITDHLPPGMQRLLTRLGETPVAVFAADWQMVWWNRAWAALLGDPAALPLRDRSLVRSRFPVGDERVRLSLWPVAVEDRGGSDRAVVADLRRATGRYPDDPRLAALVTTTLAGNPRFAQLWKEARVAGHGEDRKTIRHPEVGDITVDCDVLTDTDTDLKAVVYTAEPGSEDETKLRLALVTGAPASR